MTGAHTHIDYEDRLDDHEARLAALETPPVDPEPDPEPEPLPEPVDEFPIAWWAMSNEKAVVAHRDAGFTHNVVWSLDVTVDYLDMLHKHGIKAIPFLKPEFVGHPAVVAAVVADEPDLMVAGVPKGSVEKVTNEANRARSIWPGLPVFMTMGSPCAAGPRSANVAESVPAGYWSLSTGPYNNPDGDERYFDYASAVDIVAPQMYTVAGNPTQPRYRRQQPLDTITSAQAGVRESLFVSAGVARARRLLGPGVQMWTLLAPCVFSSTHGRNPTLAELRVEIQAAIEGGCTGNLWFDRGGRDEIPSEALLSDPEQLAIVTQVIAEVRT